MASSRPPAPGGDVVSPEVRSRIMKSVGQRNTRAEREVGVILRGIGVSYRLSNRDLPGSPDFANRRRRWAVFVNGCFWHGHKNCPKTKSGREPRVPEGNRGYWREKLTQNRVRDARKCRDLRRLGFRVVLVWECQLRDPCRVEERLTRLLQTRRRKPRC
jgi:DNA mismatch endonuclease, patch repair protein